MPEGSTILDACKASGIETPTLCFGETLTPVNACRVCVVELEGARVLVPACSRRVEAEMVIRPTPTRVRLSRKMVLEFLASSVDLSTTPAVQAYRAATARIRSGTASRRPARPERDRRRPGTPAPHGDRRHVHSR